MKSSALIAIIATAAALAGCGKDPAADLSKANSAAAAAAAENRANPPAQPAQPEGPKEPKGSRSMDIRR